MRILFLGNKSSNELVGYLERIDEEITFFAEKVTLEEIKAISPELIISYNYRYIIKDDILKEYQDRIVNLHISLLPWNRGAHPNFWSIWDGTPKGVSIHYIDEGIDTGNIIAQREVEFTQDESLRESYEKLHDEMQSLFKERWSDIKSGFNSQMPQKQGGTFHLKKDLDKIWGYIESEGGWDIKISDLLKIKSYIV